MRLLTANTTVGCASEGALTAALQHVTTVPFDVTGGCLAAILAAAASQSRGWTMLYCI